MSEKGKSAVIILVVLLILSLSAAGGAYFLFHQEHKQNLVLQDDLEDIKTRQKISESRLEEAKRMLAALDGRLKDTRGEIKELAEILETERSTKDEALAQVEILRVDLDEQRRLRIQLEEDLTYTKEALNDTQGQLDDLGSQKSELEAQINDLHARSTNLEDKMEGVELGKIVVNRDKKASKKKSGGWWPWGKKKEEPAPEQRPESQPSVPAGQMQGEILIVNRDYNFVVMNLGSKDGVAVGDLFSLYHDNKYIGDVKISKIHDSMAAADFLEDEAKDSAAEGDKVITKS